MVQGTVLQLESKRPESHSVPGRPPFTERGALWLVVPRHSFFGSLISSLAALVSRNGPKSYYSTNYFLGLSNLPRRRGAGRSVGMSVLLHCSVVALIVYLPAAIPARTAQAEEASTPVERIYYRVPVLDQPIQIPRIEPKAAGGHPSDNRQARPHPPTPASTAANQNLMIVSNPAHPDNFRQTIFQPAAPPNLKITMDQKIPNLVIAQNDEPKAPLDPSTSRPAEFNRQVSQIDAPSVAETASKQPMMAFLRTSDSQPQLAIPVSAGGAPIQRSGGSSGSSPVKPANAAGLILLGVNPAPANSQFSLPAGKRWGQFSIAAPATSSDSSAGTVHMVAAPQPSANAAGDPSKATGAGHSRAASASSVPTDAVSISGPESRAGAAGGVLNPALPMNMIYPIAAPPLNVRRNTLVISSGPTGGGVLNVYGALQCAKIYSVFLPMPGRDWSMQYCDSSAKPVSTSYSGYTTVLRLQDPLMPPDVDMTHRFDFKRIAVPIDKAHRSIILKASIAVDGTVQHVSVYHGVLPKMDEAAKLAFTRWRFKPATRDGKPIEVQVLVGIPPEIGEDRISR